MWISFAPEVPHTQYNHQLSPIRTLLVLVFLAAHFNFWFRAEGKSNTLADTLPRNKQEYFLFHLEFLLKYPSLHHGSIG